MRKERAVELYKSGYNCAQAVAMAYCDVLDMDEKTAAKTFSGFGGGFGGQHEVCGAISAMTAILGKTMGADDSDPEKKKRIYARVKEACKDFKREHGTIICRDLLVSAKKTDDSPKPCSKYIETVCEILERV